MNASVFDNGRAFQSRLFLSPQGVLTEVINLLEENDISFELRDRRVAGTKIFIKLDLKLREKQKKALKALLSEDKGLLIASTGFGKTIVGSALIAERKVSTLILVNRVELVRSVANSTPNAHYQRSRSRCLVWN